MSSFGNSVRYLEDYTLPSDDPGAPEYSSSGDNLVKRTAKRDIPQEGRDNDWDDFYRTKLHPDVKMNIFDVSRGETSVLAGMPKGQDIRVTMEGLTGCLGIFVVSHNGTDCKFLVLVDMWTTSLIPELGFFMSHSWQGSTLRNNPGANKLFESDVIGLLEYVSVSTMMTRVLTNECSSELLDLGSDSALYPEPQVFIMAATAASVDSLTTDPSSLFNSQPKHQYEDKINRVIALLETKFKVKPTVFNYLRQRADNPESQGAWGKAAVSFIYVSTTGCSSS